MRVRFKQPCGPLRIITQQLLILIRADVARPNDSRVIDVGRIVNPLLKLVLRPVAHENQLLARGCRKRLINGYAALGLSLIHICWQPVVCTAIIFGRRPEIQPSASNSSKAFHIPIRPTPPPVGYRIAAGKLQPNLSLIHI